MKKKSIILIISALAVLITAASYTVFIAPVLEKDPVEYVETAVNKGDLIVGITESGYLEYNVHTIDYDLDLTSILQNDDDEDEGTEVVKYLQIEEVYAKQGQIVEEGESLLKFSETSVQQVRRTLESALADAKVAYNEAEAEYRLAVLEAQNELETQQSAAKYAGENYDAATITINNQITYLQMEITRCQEQVAALQENVAEAQANYEEAKAKYNEVKDFYNATTADNYENYVQVKNIYDQALSAYERAKSSWEQALSKLDSNAQTMIDAQEEIKLLQATKNIDILSAKQEYEETVLAGNNAVYSYDSTVESLKEDLEEAEEEKVLLEEKLAEFETLVGEEGILYAPANCKISQSSYKAGDTLERTGTLFGYILESEMTVSVDVTQEDIVDLTVGDTVNIDFVAYEGEMYTGTIYSIDTTATSVDTPTISYTVVIKVNGTLEKLFGGMSTDITFVKEKSEDTLYISRKALVEQNGKTYVWADGNLGAKELREVTTGIRNERNVEILSGLKEDDKIYVEE